MRRLLRLLLITFALLVVLAGAAGAYLVSGGGFVTASRTVVEERASAPAWTRACRADGPAARGSTLCGAVSGKVVYIQRVDPDGDGDVHFILLSGTSLHLVKLEREHRPSSLPRLGTHIVAGGWMLRGASGKAEIDARKLCHPDASGSACAATRAFGS